MPTSPLHLVMDEGEANFPTDSPQNGQIVKKDLDDLETVGLQTDSPTVSDNPLTIASSPESSPGPDEDPQTEHFVTQCSIVYVVVGFLISMLYPAVRILGAATGDEVGTGMYNDSAFMAGPASAAAMVTSVFLQPKNMNKVYMRFLWIQAILTTLSPLIIYLSATSSSTLAWIVGFFAFISGMGVFSCSLAVRVRAANLDPKPLSRFLTDSVLIPSITTLCILTFFILDPIRCWAQLGEDEDRKTCRRTLVGQAGIGGMIITHFIIKLVSAIFPKELRAKYDLTIYNIATGIGLNFREVVTMFLDAIAVCCTFFLFAQYNSRKELSEGEFEFLIVVGGLGSGSLIVVGIWKWFLMAKEVDPKKPGAIEGGTSQVEQPEVPVIRLQRGFRILGVLAILLNLMLGTWSAITMDNHFISLQYLLMPFICLLFLVAFFSDPNREDSTFENTLFGMFMSAEAPVCIHLMKESNGNIKELIEPFARLCIWSLCFYYGSVWRHMVAYLDEERKSKFFLEAMLKNVLQEITGMLFVTFKALNCVIENTMDFGTCINNIESAMFISLCLFAYVVIKMIIGTMTNQQRKDDTVSWEKIATMTGVKKRHKISGFFMMLSGSCCMFLFCLMGANDKNTKATLRSLGAISLGSMIIVSLFEIHALTHTRNMNPLRSRTTSLCLKKTVTEIASFWIGCSALLTTAYVSLYIGFAINPRSQNMKDWSDLILPLVLLAYALSIFMKPKRTDKPYRKVFLWGHFIAQVVLTKLCGFVGFLRMGNKSDAGKELLRALLMCVVFRYALKMRRSIKNLPKTQMSDFLVHSLLVKGVACLTTVAFFMFEVISCWINYPGKEEGKQCKNTQNSSVSLSAILILATLTSIIGKAVPKEVSDESSMTKERLAEFDMKKREQLQFALNGMTGLCSLRLLSELGVAGPESNFVMNVGLVGGACAAVVFIVEVRVLLKSHLESIKSGYRESSISGDSLAPTSLRDNLGEAKKKGKVVTDSRRFSSGGLQEEMTLGGML